MNLLVRTPYYCSARFRFQTTNGFDISLRRCLRCS